MTQEKAPHKPMWLRYFKLAGGKNASGKAQIHDIVLWGSAKEEVKRVPAEALLDS